MAYRHLSDHVWEQPKQAEGRVQTRRVVNVFAAFGIAAVTASAVFVGCGYLPDSEEPVKNDQIFQPLPDQSNRNEGVAALCFLVAGLTGVLGGAAAVRNICYDNRSLEKIRQDIQDGITINEKGQPVAPGHYRCNLDDVRQQASAPSGIEAAPH